MNYFAILPFSILIFLIVENSCLHAQVTPGSSDNFITEWNKLTTSSITVLTNGTGYNYDLYWEEIDNPSNNGNLLALTGNGVINGLDSFTDYRIEIQGDFPRIFMNNNALEKDKLYFINQWGNINWGNMANAFVGCTNLDLAANDTPDLSNVESTAFMFTQCENLIGSGANWNWDMSNITNMSMMFWDATNFNQDISNWDVSNVTNMNFLFENTSFNQDINNWDVSSVTSMLFTFALASDFNQSLSDWDVSNVESMHSMFWGADSFNQDIGGWDVSNVTSMSHMFRLATEFNQNIGDWDVSNVVNMERMFEATTSFNQDIGDWDVSNVTNMQAMFRDAQAFNQDLTSWDLSSTNSLSNMFNGAINFNQDMTNLDISGITTLTSMFRNATSFNQDLSNWDISNVTLMHEIFSNSGIDCINYSNTLAGWANNPNIQNNVYLGASGITYNGGVATIRNSLISNYGWNISGDELTSTTPTFSFDNYIDVCIDGIVPELPEVFDNGFIGTWSQPVVDNTIDWFYLFTPDISVCARWFNLYVTIVDTEENCYTSTSEVNNLFTINIYPNPASEFITISSENDYVIDEIELYSVTGQKIAIDTEKKGDTYFVDLLVVNDGVYFIKVITGNMQTTKKIIKH